MKAIGEFVTQESEYYIYTPSKLAQDMFLYPLRCGKFFYKPGYYIKRDTFDSFLLMYINKGEMNLEISDLSYHITQNSFVLVDCYQSHSYSTSMGCECLWCHFDGITARLYFENIVSRLSNTFTLPDPYPVVSKMTSIQKIFNTGAVVREPLLSKYLNDILTEFMLHLPSKVNALNNVRIAETAVTYINEHFAENISVTTLAEKVGLSHYHFIRTFKRETGFTPHEYILNTRIATAQYLLKNTKLSVKDICYNTGFSCESVFCSAFKRKQGMTPSEYRSME